MITASNELSIVLPTVVFIFSAPIEKIFPIIGRLVKVHLKTGETMLYVEYIVWGEGAAATGSSAEFVYQLIQKDPQ